MKKHNIIKLKMKDTKQILKEFKDAIDVKKSYNLEEMCSILTKVYEEKDTKVKEKRAPSSYNKFMSERMKELKISKPEMNSKELMKECSVMWSGLSQEEKDKYK